MAGWRASRDGRPWGRLGGLLVGVVAAAWGGCGGPAPRAAPAEAPPVPSTAAYVGSARCVACHAQEGATWARTTHGRHGTFDAAGVGAGILAVGSSWMQAYMVEAPGGLHAIAARCLDLGTRTWRAVPEVLAEIGGTGADDLESPGPPQVAALEERRFETDCAGCHATGAALALDPGAGRLVSTWVETAIGCEACHGPGRAHAEAWARADPAAPLVRLERLPARAATAVCARCHGGPPAGAAFDPADAPHYLAEVGDRQGQFPDGRAAGQVYQAGAFVRSGCYQRGGLTCARCHDPHGSGRHGGAGGDTTCLTCHPGMDRREHTHHAPAQDGARCVSCHMPRLLTGLVGHQRDHRIGIPLPQVASSPDACTACHREHDKAWASEAWERWWGAAPAATVEAVAAVASARRGAPDRGALERLLDHEDAFFRVEAVRRLGAVTRGATDAAPEVRLAAVRALGDDAAGRAVLDALAHDPELRVRAAAWVRRAMFGLPVPDTAVADLVGEARQVRGTPAQRRLLGMLVARAGGRHDGARWLEEAWLATPLDPRMAIEAAGAWATLGEAGRAAAVLQAAAGAQPPGPARQMLEQRAGTLRGAPRAQGRGP